MADTKTDAVVKPRIEPKLELKPPSQYKVIYINDEVTTMEFVIESLRSIFERCGSNNPCSQQWISITS